MTLVHAETGEVVAPLTDDEMQRVQALVSGHFGMEPEEHKFKGEMAIPEELALLLA